MLSKELKKERDKLIACINIAKSLSDNSIIGSLKIRRDNDGTIHYYHEIHGKELPLPEHATHIIRGLAQNSYNRKVVEDAKRKIDLIDSFCKIYNFDSLKNLHHNLKPDRQVLIKPVQVSDSEFIHSWKKIVYHGNPMDFGNTNYFTLNNERVRSKTEVLLANKFYYEGIPYRYEFPVQLSGKTFYPTFRLLNAHEKKEYILDNCVINTYEDICSALDKVLLYAENKWFINEDLLLHFETRNVPFNEPLLDALLNHFLKQ